METPVIVATLGLCLLSQSLFAQNTTDPVVINEIHYDEADKTLRGEFIELFNRTEADVDLSGGVHELFIGSEAEDAQIAKNSQGVDAKDAQDGKFVFNREEEAQARTAGRWERCR